jgi:putative adhesin
MRTTLATRSMVAAGLLTLLTVAPAAAQGDFHWNGRLTSGQSIEIRGINGDIRATASSSGDVEVTAIKTARRGNPDDVRIEVVPHGGGVTICAVYPSSRGREPNTCEPGGGKSNTQNNDTSVNFDVRVPYGVNFVGRTVNGEISGESLQGDAEGHTVNGSINLTTTGLAVANTVNGSINVTMGRADWANGASFKTVNGEIKLTLPSAFDADLHAETLNGSITSDFPITVTGQVSRRKLSGTIGAGGRSLDLKTVNGSIKLMRAQ